MTERLAVLTPVRNGEEDLPGYFTSVARFADLVVALDDGSTDATRAMLEGSPIVAKVLTNPRRHSYEGWDDAGNRRRLLDALSELDDISWVFFLDADERLHEADAVALRGFIEKDAYRGFAYGFEVFRMVEGLERFDADSQMWVYRMFGYRPGLELPDTRLHFVPIPVSIDRKLWIRTTLRIQHLGGADAKRRANRFRKYEEADPHTEFQATYDHLLEPPATVRGWQRRLPQTPVVVSAESQFTTVASHLADEEESRRPIVSAVVISQNDEHTIARSLQALVDQDLDQPYEVIVVTSGTDGTAAVVADGFPSVRVIQLPRPALPGEARNAGLWVARGHYVSFPGSHVVAGPGSLRARVEAHDAGWDLVTGTTRNGNPTIAGWASYFLDHSSVLPARPSTELTAAPSHCSYVRSDLDEVGGFPEDMRAGEDTVVNLELFRRGRRAYREQAAVIVHSSRARTLTQMAQHHFVRGRAWGRILQSRYESRRRLLLSQFSSIVVAPMRRIRMVARNVFSWGGSLTPHYQTARWHIAVGALAAGAGTVYQTLQGAPTPAEPAPVGEKGVGDRVPLIVAHQGSPAASEFGILGLGPEERASTRLRGHVDRQPQGTTTPAIYVVAVAATVIPGRDGSYTVTMPDDQIRVFLSEARRIGGQLIVGVQPELGSFSAALRPLRHLLAESDVGVGLQPQWRGTGADALRWPRADLEAALEMLDQTVDRRLLVLIHETPTTSWPADWAPHGFRHLDIVGVADVVGDLETKAAALVDLAQRAPAIGLQIHYRRDPEAPEPFDLIRSFPDLRIVVYQ